MDCAQLVCDKCDKDRLDILWKIGGFVCNVHADGTWLNTDNDCYRRMYLLSCPLVTFFNNSNDT